MPAAKLPRYILYNLGLLVLACVAGLVTLGIVRQLGTDMVARDRAADLMAESRALFDEGNIFECQTRLRQALATHPSAIADAVAVYGPGLIGLPQVQDRLRELAVGDDIEFARPAANAEALLLLDHEEAGARLEAALGEGTSEDAGLWLGRLALREGDIETARGCFEAYWLSAPEERADLRDQLMPRKTGSAQDYHRAGRRLFASGLWEEAFEAFDSARRAGAEGPDLRCFEAIALELAGDQEGAIRVYREVVAVMPNHRLALLRLASIGDDASVGAPVNPLERVSTPW